MEFGKADWRTFERGIEKEWLLTNGIGGFASSTIICANTRRYHGLLVASLKAPVERHLILSKIDECFTINGKDYNLYSFQTPDYIMRGYYNLQRVSINPLPTFTYSVEDAFIEKKICMVYGQNTTVIQYRIINGAAEANLRLTPLINFRNYHHSSRSEFLKFDVSKAPNGAIIKPAYFNTDISLLCGEGEFTVWDGCYFFNMYYEAERERGLDYIEDHYIPGCFDIKLKSYEEKHVTIIATLEKEVKDCCGEKLISAEEKRLKALVSTAGYGDELADRLVMASDAFIVHRESTKSRTILAGYPWFTDWGRDTMIAFTGITLATKRFEDARDILYTFSRYVKDGLVPNVFPDDESHEPAYNSVDAALWYFEAVNKYIEHTDDLKFINENIYMVLKDIIGHYIKGTRFNIAMDSDYLISAGQAGIQLTWMDAKIGRWVVTPRHGKAVEINALWYNAINIMERLAGLNGDDAGYYRSIAEKARKSFEAAFWNNRKQCLYDVVINDYRDSSVRPNQIFAVSLSYPVISGEKAKKLVRKVWKELYSTYGLKSLCGSDRNYRGIYTGDIHSRDSSYHQGTVWTWPLGHFITAFIKAYGNTESNRRLALKFIEPLRDHLSDGCIGSISEIFDGDGSNAPKGCFAQAWSVGEILRAYTELIAHGSGDLQ
ncbi:putative glycogen debranching enzyme [Anaerobacterium chartisolvens]|uniref:Putative glycogen debranching enzyme n=1 Tax=Anaerobacterium chartisolvens TaxID=1297424 RepID=A0A369API8_9FIRM|nr:amylo-alpha-1,6-glucosidase [Anaerobacterium chartisolvens]RCX11282.1 putative glycogen debranching enzyme [Anaerobacterium chartisolvens]